MVRTRSLFHLVRTLLASVVAPLPAETSQISTCLVRPSPSLESGGESHTAGAGNSRVTVWTMGSLRRVPAAWPCSVISNQHRSRCSPVPRRSQATEFYNSRVPLNSNSHSELPISRMCRRPLATLEFLRNNTSDDTFTISPSAISQNTDYTVDLATLGSDTQTPVVAGIVPTSGPTTGSTSVTITGTNLANASTVSFGLNTGAITADSATLITATSPAGSAGTVDVTVTTAGGTSAISSADHFTYVLGPTVTRVSPNTGGTAGGTSVTITGTLFTGATAVKFGSVAATSFTLI